MSDYTAFFPFNTTEKSHVNCPCGTVPDGAQLKRHGWSFVRCRKCGTYTLTPRPTEAAFDRFYRSHYDYAGGSDLSISLATARANPWLASKNRRVIETIKKHAPPGVLLDFGCGYGQFLVHASSAFQSVGVEPSKTARQLVVEELGIACVDSPDALAPDVTFTAIVSHHVVEHLTEPVRMLTALRSRLAKDGILILVTPNADALPRRLLGSRWEWCAYPIHTHLFSSKGLAKTVEAAGYETLTVHSRIGDLPSPRAMARATARLAGRDGAYLNKASTGVGAAVRPQPPGPRRLAYWRAMTAMIGLLAPLGRTLDPALCLGDEIVLVARKRDEVR